MRGGADAREGNPDVSFTPPLQYQTEEDIAKIFYCGKGLVDIETQIKFLAALRAKIVEMNQGRGDSGFIDFLSKKFNWSYNHDAIGKGGCDAVFIEQYPQLLKHLEDIEKDIIKRWRFIDYHTTPLHCINAAIYRRYAIRCVQTPQRRIL
ncbi:MAG: hypothetical protein LBL30_01645 [Holosporales bacterium]|nr:hypothetical protein [Holosporales bacterium]